jgi:hypothetical protein
MLRKDSGNNLTHNSLKYLGKKHNQSSERPHNEIYNISFLKSFIFSLDDGTENMVIYTDEPYAMRRSQYHYHVPSESTYRNCWWL